MDAVEKLSRADPVQAKSPLRRVGSPVGVCGEGTIVPVWGLDAWMGAAEYEGMRPLIRPYEPPSPGRGEGSWERPKAAKVLYAALRATFSPVGRRDLERPATAKFLWVNPHSGLVD